MLRLAVPLVLLLLSLFAGAVWLIDLEPRPVDPVDKAAKSEPARQTPEPRDSIIEDTADALAPGQPQDSAPSFDIARIEPEGTSVFAGRAEPNTYVTITADGTEVGTAKVDEQGEWTLTTEERIPNPDAKLALFKASQPPAPAASTETQRAEAPAPDPAPSQAATPPDRKTAGAVTSTLLKNLEGMVAEARSDQQQQVATAPSVPPPQVEAADPARQPEPSVATPAVEEPKPATEMAVAPPAVAPPAAEPTRELPQPAASTISVPVPVTFVFNEATLTSDGARAAGLLLEYLQLRGFSRITLTGHADERGSHELNMALSRERLETVARFLRNGGFRGQLDLVPKGKTEPYTGVVRSDFSRDDLYQLDRRVELVITR